MIIVKDDGYFIDSVGIWAERKYELVEQYANMFATSMKKKWNARVYIDLFSSSGYAKFRNTNRLVMTSPLIAVNVKNKFDKYIFCEIDPIKMDALSTRITANYPEVNAEYILGDCNSIIDEVVNNIPGYSKDYKVLSLCFVDPYKVDNLSFNTIRLLSKKIMDFLILVPSFMDANRNHDINSKLIDKFLGSNNWRKHWEEEKKSGITFGTFFVKMFNKSMVEEGFLSLDENEYILIRNPKNNSPMYHLAFYSKSDLGKKFWNNAIKGSTPQIEMF